MRILFEKVCSFLQIVLLYGLLLYFPRESTTQFIFQSETNATHQLRIKKILCVETPYMRTNLLYCNLGQFPNQSVFLNASLEIPMLINYLVVTTQLFYKYTTYHPFLFDWSVEICQALRYPKRRNLITGVVMKVIAETMPQFMYKCPHGNRTYTTVWHMDSKYVFKTIPSGDYRLDGKFSDRDNVTLFALQVFGTVRKTGLVG